MKLVILCAEAQSPTLARIINTGSDLGHTVTLISPLHCYFKLTNNRVARSSLLVDGQTIDFDMLLTRLGSVAPNSALQVVRNIEQMGILSINSSMALSRVHNKSDCYFHLAQAAIPIPETVAFGSESSIDDIVDLISGPPWIVKIEHGRGGIGVMLCESFQSLKSVVAVLQQQYRSLLLQEFIRESNGEDIRVLVIGGKAIAAIRRRAPAGDFRSNIKLGGKAERVELTATLTSIAETAATAMGLEIAGVDILESARGPLITEINASPALSGVSQAHDHNFAIDLIEFLKLRMNGNNK